MVVELHDNLPHCMIAQKGWSRATSLIVIANGGHLFAFVPLVCHVISLARSTIDSNLRDILKYG
jgi:hypothetical protein